MKTQNFKLGPVLSMTCSVALSLLASASLMSCSTTRALKAVDCEVKPDAFGACAVDAGLSKQEIEKFASYCESRNVKTDRDAIERARVAREKEVCLTPRGVFELQFRASAGINGPVTCPKDLTITKDQQRAVEDGKAAAFAFGKKDPNGNELAHAQQRRFNADRNGYDVGLSDRTVLIDTREDLATRDTYRNQFEKIIDSYSGVVEQELVTERRCTVNGPF